ncbi:MAG: calcium/proton exchanger [Deltaproteobacteria bacterium]
MKYLKYLLIFVPISFALELLHYNQTWVFITACLAIVPLAGVMGEATENIAVHTGPKLGGFLNATFGNATEMIIAIFAIRAGQHDIAKASIAGSIIGNVLLVLGASMLFGGFKHKIQTFNQKASVNSATLLIFAAIGLVIPAVFLNGTTPEQRLAYEGLSIANAIIMILIYILGLIFSFFTHKDILSCVDEEKCEAKWGKYKALVILLIATVAVAFESEILVGSIEATAKSLGWNDMFIGIIILAIIGNAAEHSTAIIMAIKNKMDVALEIAVGSSLQIALFVAPVLVFASLLFGKPMDLIFHPFELAGIGLAVLIANFISQDGESHWLEGAQLIGVYIILAFAFYFAPIK